jgi:hypothetical protein
MPSATSPLDERMELTYPLSQERGVVSRLALSSTLHAKEAPRTWRGAVRLKWDFLSLDTSRHDMDVAVGRRPDVPLILHLIELL